MRRYFTYMDPLSLKILWFHPMEPTLTMPLVSIPVKIAMNLRVIHGHQAMFRRILLEIST